VSAAVLVARVGAAHGAREAAAALACAGSEADRAGLMVDLDAGRAPRPGLIATAAARELEERLAAHIPGVGVASRGRICRLALPDDEAGLELAGAALAIGRGSTAALHLPPRLVQAALERPLCPTAGLLRADLADDRALTALAVGDLLERGLRVAVLKHPIGWVAARAALAGLSAPTGAAGIPTRIGRRLLDPDGQ
jgi:hypothetical protein